MKKLTAKVLAGTMAVAMVFSTAAVATPETATAKTKVTVKKVTVKAPSGKTAYVAKGKKISLTTTVKVTPNKAANKKVTYKSANKKIATVTSKGVVKGVKAGTTKITVTSKKNKKKKATIKVVVKKTAVKKIKLNATKATLTVGQKKTLKATVTAAKTASKKVVWSTSKKKVATVTSKGKVTAKKAGSATITVKAADGSGKKATCKVTVKAAKTNLTKAGVDNARTVTFALDKKTALDKSKVTLKRKSNKDGAYQDTLILDDLTTSDSINYSATLSYKSALSLYEFVQVNVPTLNGTKTAEAQYLEDAAAYTDEEVWTGNVDEYFYNSYDFGYGYGSYTISALPDGLTAVDEYGSFVVKGTPTKAGLTEATLKGTDERGNTITTTIYFAIGSEDQIVGAGAPKYILEPENDKQSYTSYFYLAGGSGSYKYEVTDDGKIGAKLDNEYSRSVTYNPTKAGDYVIKVKVTDSNNDKITAEISIPVHVVAAITISGTVKDATGAGMMYSDVNIYFSNKNRGARVSKSVSASYDEDSNNFLKADGSTDSDAYRAEMQKHFNGAYHVRVAAGTYDISVSYKDGADVVGTQINLYKQAFDAAKTGVDFTLPVYKVTLKGDKDNYFANVHPEKVDWTVQGSTGIDFYHNWYDTSKDEEVEKADLDLTAFTYLPAGSYVIRTGKRSSYREIDGYKYESTPAAGTLDWFNGATYTTTETVPRYRLTASVNVANANAEAGITKADETAKVNTNTRTVLGAKNTTYTASELDTRYYLEETYDSARNGYYYGYKFTPSKTGAYKLSNSDVYFYSADGTKVATKTDAAYNDYYELTAGTTYIVATGYSYADESFRISQHEVVAPTPASGPGVTGE